jgi:hypothetical protein
VEKVNVSAEMHALSATTPLTWRTPLFPHLCVTPSLNVVCVQQCPRVAATKLRKEQASPAGYVSQPASLDPLTTLSQAKVDQFRRYLASTVAAQVPSVGGSMAVLGFDTDLQDMLDHARDR